MATIILFCALTIFTSLISSVVRGSPIEISAGDPGTLWPNNPFATLLTFDDLPNGSLAFYEFAGVSLMGNGAIEANTIPGISAQPAGDSTRYLTVSYLSPAGDVLFKFSGQENYFGLYWGSMDRYNTITFLNDNVKIASFSGVTVASLTGLVADGDQHSSLSNRYINFFLGSNAFDEVVLSTTYFGFEVDNIAFGDPSVPMPEPSTLVLVGSFLCLTFFLPIRRRPHIENRRAGPDADAGSLF